MTQKPERLTYHKVTNKDTHVLYRGERVVGHVQKVTEPDASWSATVNGGDDEVTGPTFPTVMAAAAWAEGYLTDLPPSED